MFVRVLCTACGRLSSREYGGGILPTHCLRCQKERDRELKRQWDRNCRRRVQYPCRVCNSPCAHPGGRCRECYYREKPDMRDGAVIGTQEWPPHPDPLMDAHLRALHERARQQLPLFPARRERDSIAAARAC